VLDDVWTTFEKTERRKLKVLGEFRHSSKKERNRPKVRDEFFDMLWGDRTEKTGFLCRPGRL